MPEVFHFGAVGRPGHYLRSNRPGSDFAGAGKASSLERRNPWGLKIDTGLCPPGKQVEGRALVHHKNGWTALSFWDRSVDTRGGSCSTFLVWGTFDFAEMLALMREQWPDVMARFKFPIIDAAVAAVS